MIILIFGDLMRSRKKKQVLTQLGINVFGMVIHIARPKSVSNCMSSLGRPVRSA